MKAGVTPKLESKWWKDNKDLLVPEDPLGKALKQYEAAKTVMQKDPSMNNFHQAVFLVGEVNEKAKTQIGKCNSLLHKDTIAALKKYKDVVKDEQETIDETREKYKNIIETEVEKFRVPAQASLKRLVELVDAVKERLKSAKTAVKDGKGREMQTELTGHLKELATRYTQCNMVSNDLERLAAKRDYELVCANPIKDMKRDLGAGRKNALKTLELLRDAVDAMSKNQGDQESEEARLALAKFKKDVDEWAKALTNTKLDAQLSTADVHKIHVDEGDAPAQIKEWTKNYKEYEQKLVKYIKEAAEIQHPVALLLKKSEEGKISLKKLKAALADDAVDLKRYCTEQLRILDKLTEQTKTYADWVKRSVQLEKAVAELEQILKVALNVVKQAKTTTLKQTDFSSTIGALSKVASDTANLTGLKDLLKEVNGQFRDMPVTAREVPERLVDLEKRTTVITKSCETATEEMMKLMTERFSPTKDKK